MYTKVIVLALAALAVAGPSHIARQTKGGQSKNGETKMFNKDASCGKNSQVYCCNTQTAEKLTGKGTFPVNADIADLKGLLGQCNEVKVALVPIDVLKKACSQDTVCCGTTKQQGVANFGCTTVHT